jgi:hypothetical protein
MIIVSVILTFVATTFAYRQLLKRRKRREAERAKTLDIEKKILGCELEIARIEKEQSELRELGVISQYNYVNHKWIKSLEREVDLEEKLDNLKKVNDILRKEKGNRGYDAGRRSAIL